MVAFKEAEKHLYNTSRKASFISSEETQVALAVPSKQEGYSDSVFFSEDPMRYVAWGMDEKHLLTLTL